MKVEKSVKRKIAGRAQAPACLRKKQFKSIFLKALDNVFTYIKNKNKSTFKICKNQSRGHLVCYEDYINESNIMRRKTRRQHNYTPPPPIN